MFVYLETGTSSGDVITGVEMERGLRALKLDAQVDAPSLLAAMGAKSKGKGTGDVQVAYKDFSRHLSLEASGSGSEGLGGGGGLVAGRRQEKKV